MRALSDVEQIELLQLVRALQHENERLRAAIARAFCGAVLDSAASCQLPRGHETCHAWMSPDGELIIRWGS